MFRYVSEYATNYKDHETYRPRPFSEIVFVHFREIVHMHPYVKLQVCSFIRFDDMFEGMPNIIRVT